MHLATLGAMGVGSGNMPLRDELIQRAIQQLALAFAALLERQGQQAATAELLPAAEATALRRQLDQLYSTFMGSSAQLVKRLSSDDLLRVLGSAGFVDGERAYLLSSLLETEAQLAVSLGAEDASDEVLELRVRALDLMLEAGSAALGEPDIAERVARLLGGVPPDLRSPGTWERLVWFGFDTGEFAAGEDALFAWLEVEQAAGEDTSRVARTGENFYGRLHELEDEALDRGGLPRDELAEGRAELLRALA